MRPFLLEAPVGPLLQLDDLKKHIRVEGDGENTLVEAYERAAVALLDGYSGILGRCVLKQKWALPLMGCPDAVFLPFPDCRDFQIEQRLSSGDWIDVENVAIQQDGDCVSFVDLPCGEAGLHLTCWAGWETADEVKETLKQAVRMLTAHWFDNRSAVTTGQAPHNVPLGFQGMIAPLVHVFV
ncbi:MAG: head-tail connector protein [Aliishimia sp.]